MKIIAVDNYGRDNISDRLIAEGIDNKEYARVMCASLNKEYSGEHSYNWFKVVPDDYTLYEFKP